MHPTADTTALNFGNRSGRRVMPGVRMLGFLKSLMETCGGQRRAALSQSDATFFFYRAALRLLLGGASRKVRGSEYHRSREAQVLSIAHPNKRMHPTADTVALK